MIRRSIQLWPIVDLPSTVAQFRSRFDPLAAILPVHVTLVFPFNSELSVSEVQLHVAKVCSGMSRFSIELGPSACVDGGYVWLSIAQGAAFVTELHKRLYSGPLLPFLDLSRVYEPHVTIGRYGADERGAVERMIPRLEGSIPAIVEGVVTEVIGDDDSSTKESFQAFCDVQPNQALEPTALAVTPAAGAPVAPAKAVAHLSR